MFCLLVLPAPSPEKPSPTFQPEHGFTVWKRSGRDGKGLLKDGAGRSLVHEEELKFLFREFDPQEGK